MTEVNSDGLSAALAATAASRRSARKRPAKKHAKPARALSRKHSRARKAARATSRTRKLSRPSKGRPVAPARKRKSGYILTAKNLPKRSYDAIHTAPHGVRQKMLHALLAAAAAFLSRHRKDGVEKMAKGKVRIVPVPR